MLRNIYNWTAYRLSFAFSPLFCLEIVYKTGMGTDMKSAPGHAFYFSYFNAHFPWRSIKLFNVVVIFFFKEVLRLTMHYNRQHPAKSVHCCVLGFLSFSSRWGLMSRRFAYKADGRFLVNIVSLCMQLKKKILGFFLFVWGREKGLHAEVHILASSVPLLRGRLFSPFSRAYATGMLCLPVNAVNDCLNLDNDLVTVDGGDDCLLFISCLNLHTIQWGNS